MEATKEGLRLALEQMLEDLNNPVNHYMISATYFKHIGPGNVDLDKHNFAIIYLNQDAAWNVELLETSLDLDVLLNPDEPEEKYRIRIPLSEIWSIQKSDSKTFTDVGRMFYSESVFKNMLSPKND